MVPPKDAADKLIAAYNAQDFDTMSHGIAPHIDFAHFNRNFILTDRDALIGTLKDFAAKYFVNRHFEQPERVSVCDDTVIREGWYVGTPRIDLPGFGAAGEAFRLKFCSVMRFDSAGLLVEWKDYG